ncbi:unnamed protein product, partial [Urochloa humidicola]
RDQGGGRPGRRCLARLRRYHLGGHGARLRRRTTASANFPAPPHQIQIAAAAAASVPVALPRSPRDRSCRPPPLPRRGRGIRPPPLGTVTSTLGPSSTPPTAPTATSTSPRLATRRRWPGTGGDGLSSPPCQLGYTALYLTGDGAPIDGLPNKLDWRNMAFLPLPRFTAHRPYYSRSNHSSSGHIKMQSKAHIEECCKNLVY